jgi:urease subunit gamma/beta
MHLTPREHERLLLAAAADLARRRLARGAPLGATEAVALVCDEICELAWDGVPLEEVIAHARTVIPPGSLLPGVAALIPVIEVEALFPWGSTLVHVAAPFGEDQEQAGPERLRLAPAAPHAPGAVLPRDGVIELAAGAARRTARLRNTGPRDVWISSHFPLGEVNPAVRVRWAGEEETVRGRRAGEDGAVRVRAGEDEAAPVPDDASDPRTAADSASAGPRPPWRLDLPAGEALLLRAGEEREVTVIVGSG